MTKKRTTTEQSVSDQHSHSVRVDGKKHTWYVKRLWALAENMPTFEYDIATFRGFEEDYWFGDRHKPTLMKVLEHQQKIARADLLYPIILSESGLVMDGIHRICRAYLENRKSILAVRFLVNPEADVIED
jgi:hypothetical protein